MRIVLVLFLALAACRVAPLHRRGDKMWELRATVSLCRLWQAQGRSAAAHARLAEVYGWFTEGFDTPDLLAAKALLTELASA